MISWRPSVNQYVSVRLLGAVVRGRRFLLFSRIFLQEPSPSLPPPQPTPHSLGLSWEGRENPEMLPGGGGQQLKSHRLFLREQRV